MAYVLDAAGRARLDLYFDGIGTMLRRRDRRESFALYAMGLFGDSERKSVEPIAARACADPALCNAYHDRLLHFLAVAPWSDAQVRAYAAGYGVSAMTACEPVTDWIVDDTGFPKQGDKSPGVQRQYSGTLGKTGNCQVAVSVTIATSTMHLPLDMDLYLPQSWDFSNIEISEQASIIVKQRVVQLFPGTYVHRYWLRVGIVLRRLTSGSLKIFP